MERDTLLMRAKSALEEAFGGRLKGVVLYGSEARGQAEPDSDIDLLVLLAGPVDYWRDLQACIHAWYPLVLRIERPIHAKPVDLEAYRAGREPLYVEARREGILA